MSEWRKVKLETLIKIKHGFAFKGAFFSPKGEYLLLSPRNFKEEGGLKLGSKEKFYIGDFPKEFILKKDDLLLVMTDLVQEAPILGGALIVPKDAFYLHNQRLGLVSFKSNSIDKKYAYYVFNSQYYKGQVRGSATGATVRHTSPERIYGCKIFLPPLQTQKRIANILSTYDDLIENNQKRIAILEQMAQNLYKEWFVRFRFPNWESVEFVDGLPNGWEKVKIEKVVTLSQGQVIRA